MELKQVHQNRNSLKNRTFCSCDLDLDPLTLTYEPDLQTLIPAHLKWTFQIKVFKSYNITDRHTDSKIHP